MPPHGSAADGDVALATSPHPNGRQQLLMSEPYYLPWIPVEVPRNNCRTLIRSNEKNRILKGELGSLITKEEAYYNSRRLYDSFRLSCYLARAHREGLEWMLKVSAHYSFSVLTAILAANYLDRFLSSFPSHKETPWMIQLAVVACLALAAKVEET